MYIENLQILANDFVTVGSLVNNKRKNLNLEYSNNKIVTFTIEIKNKNWNEHYLLVKPVK
jgi:hypothetical protein